MPLPIPGVGDVPKNAIVHSCGSWWTGNERSHCGGCHATFTSLTSFERHRKGMHCNPPEQVGLVARDKPYGVLWGLPAPVGGYAGLYGRDEVEEAAA